MLWCYVVALWVVARYWQCSNSCSPSWWTILYVDTCSFGWSMSGITCKCVENVFGLVNYSCSLHRGQWTHSMCSVSTVIVWLARLRKIKTTACPSWLLEHAASLFSLWRATSQEQPCAPANGTKTKQFIRLIASVCTSLPKWVSRDQRRTGHAWDWEYKWKRSAGVWSWKTSLKASDANHMKRMIKGCIHT